MTTKDRIENAIHHIQTAVDVDPWAVEIAVEAMQEKISREPSEEPKTAENGSTTCMNPEKTHDRTTGDLISRQAAIDAISAEVDLYGGSFRKGLNMAKGCVQNLPSAQPEHKTGRWMRYGEDGGHNDHDTVYWQCDQCLNTERGRREKPMKFCPSCGARMQP